MTAAALPVDPRLAYTLPEAERVVPYSQSTLRRAALKPFDDGVFPHPLEAKRDANGRILITRDALQEWLDRLPAA